MSTDTFINIAGKLVDLLAGILQLPVSTFAVPSCNNILILSCNATHFPTNSGLLMKIGVMFYRYMK